MISTTMKIHSPVIIEYIAVKYGSFLGFYDQIFTMLFL